MGKLWAIVAAVCAVACAGQTTNDDDHQGDGGTCAPSPVGWVCGGDCHPDGYLEGGPRCEGATSCGVTTQRSLVADLPDQAVLLPAAGADTGCCAEGAVAARLSVWVPAGVRAAVVATDGRGVLGEPWHCGEPLDLPQCHVVDGGDKGARAWVLAAPGAPAGSVRLVVGGSCAAVAR